MTTETDKILNSTIIEDFKKGARLYHHGCFLADTKIQRAGINTFRQAVERLDAQGPEGRNALIPLMNDPDPGIQVLAAGHLMKIMPERALPVIQYIDKHCITEATMTAMDFLLAHRRGEIDV